MEKISFATNREATWKVLRRYLGLGIGLSVVLPVLWLSWAKGYPLWSVLSDPERLIGTAQQLGPLAPLTLGLLLMLQVIIPVIPGQAVTLTIGYLYGPTWGGLLTATALLLSGQLAFAIARYAGRPMVYRVASPKALAKWEHFSEQQSVVFYACVYTLPFMPSDLLVYVAGLGRISPRRFTVANILGRLPLGVVTAVFGAYHFRPPGWFWAVPVLIVLVALVGSYRSLRWTSLITNLVNAARFKLRPSKRGAQAKDEIIEPCSS